MPISPTYPGVYIEEIPSGVRTIVGVATSITAFIGRSLMGPVNEPVRIQGFPDFERRFGGLWVKSTLSYAVYQYFLNGGADALIVRVHNGATKASLSLQAGSDILTLEAINEGEWGNNLQAIIDYNTKDKDSPSPDSNLFNLTIQKTNPITKEVQQAEVFRNISVNGSDARFVTKVLEQESTLVRVQGTVPSTRPDASLIDAVTNKPIAQASNNDGGDGSDLTDIHISSPSLEVKKEGIWALKKADLFNLLCIPPLTHENDIGTSTLSAALKYCKDQRAMLIVDPPSVWNDVSKVFDSTLGVDKLNLRDENAAIFFPRLKMPDPLKENRLEEFVPCGAVAGVFARTDAQRGVWKAPAGIDTILTGVAELTMKLTDGENGLLNPLGVNCLRDFPGIGRVVWGARTLEGADHLASEWKYVPVRRTALFLEESLYRGLKWVVFEPNDEPLWAQIRLNVGAFMNNLFRQGAFQGKTPREAYFVKCDSETTTQTDINLGIVNILVGFAPLKPAEFVIIKIQQMAGQIQT
ncbi:MAG: phage tail sheath subtilisin-like domain-containing protein [Candidatus Jettenia sp.]|nr:phage tail sheath subtilisin-like domain-containing protein [Candidatus Jettenia sp.]